MVKYIFTTDTSPPFFSPPLSSFFSLALSSLLPASISPSPIQPTTSPFLFAFLPLHHPRPPPLCQLPYSAVSPAPSLVTFFPLHHLHLPLPIQSPTFPFLFAFLPLHHPRPPPLCQLPYYAVSPAPSLVTFFPLHHLHLPLPHPAAHLASPISPVLPSLSSPPSSSPPSSASPSPSLSLPHPLSHIYLEDEDNREINVDSLMGLIPLRYSTWAQFSSVVVGFFLLLLLCSSGVVALRYSTWVFFVANGFVLACCWVVSLVLFGWVRGRVGQREVADEVLLLRLGGRIGSRRCSTGEGRGREWEVARQGMGEVARLWVSSRKIGIFF